MGQGIEGVLSMKVRSHDGFECYEAYFANGYGANLARGHGSYGGDDGLWELAVMKGGDLCYTTPITNDVVGYLSEKEARARCEKIAQLPAA